MAEALRGRRRAFLDEDYLVFAVTALDETLTSEQLVEQHGADIAQLLRGERQPLSAAGAGRGTAPSAVVSGRRPRRARPGTPRSSTTRPAGAQAAIEILEFANSQLLEFRYYDELLDERARRASTRSCSSRAGRTLFGAPRTRAPRAQVHALFIDVNELTDRTENALKFVGDIYAARLFALVAARLGLDRWKENVEEKLKTLDDIYRLAVEQTGMSQGNVLELVIVLILILELGLLLAGITK